MDVDEYGLFPVSSVISLASDKDDVEQLANGDDFRSPGSVEFIDEQNISTIENTGKLFPDHFNSIQFKFNLIQIQFNSIQLKRMKL